jgi:hypothetical protein
MVDFVRGTRRIADKNGDTATPIRVAEYGWATSGRPPERVTTEACQAALLYAGTRRFVELRNEVKLRSIIQFQWRDVSTTDTVWPHYAGLLRVDGTAKPGLGALSDAIAERPPPAGLTLVEACPEDRRADVVIGGHVADDAFSRTVSDGWGSAAKGGAYTIGAGTSADYAVSGGEAHVTVPVAGTSRFALLDGASTKNTDLRVEFTTDRAAAGLSSQLFGAVARHVGDGTEYRVRVRVDRSGAVFVALTKLVDGAEAVLGSEVQAVGVAHVPGEHLALRATVMGDSPTVLRAKVWAVRRDEPDAWLLERTDDEEELQGAGSVGVRAELPAGALNAPVVFDVDNLDVVAPK